MAIVRSVYSMASFRRPTRSSRWPRSDKDVSCCSGATGRGVGAGGELAGQQPLVRPGGLGLGALRRRAQQFTARGTGVGVQRGLQPLQVDADTGLQRQPGRAVEPLQALAAVVLHPRDALPQVGARAFGLRQRPQPGGQLRPGLAAFERQPGQQRAVLEAQAQRRPAGDAQLRGVEQAQFDRQQAMCWEGGFIAASAGGVGGCRSMLAKPP
ncbi:MAG: hypothetical protein LCI02_27805 [Proteobacteria bacterium]|nr:hypothetical protein [Pseudomonadota bacterium]